MSDIMKIRINNERLFYIMIYLIAIHQCLSDVKSLANYYAYVKPIVMGGIIFLAILQFMFENRSMTRRQCFVLFFLGISFLTSYFIGSTWLIYFFLIAFYLKEKNLDKIIKIIIIIETIVFSINMLIFIINFLCGNTEELEFFTRFGESIRRWYVYYNSPNGASRNLIFICLGWMYLRGAYLRLGHYFLMLLISMLVFFFTLSDAVMIVPLSIALFVIFPRFKEGKCILDILRSLVFTLGLGVSIIYIVISMLGLSAWLEPINEFLTGRLSLAYQSFVVNGITILGQEALLGYQNVNGRASLIYCDNAYVYCLICYGVIYLLMFTYVFLKIFKSKMTIRDNTVLIIFGLYMLIENRFIDIPTSIPLIIVFYEYINVNFPKRLHYNKCEQSAL